MDLFAPIFANKSKVQRERPTIQIGGKESKTQKDGDAVNIHRNPKNKGQQGIIGRERV